jgi:5-methylcytosine-specific restriction protein B
MNLIDQSVEQLDFALRRRFFWLLADYDEKFIVPVVQQRWEALDLNAQPWLRRHTWDYVEPDIQLLAARATELNKAITAERLLGSQYKIGHTYLFDVVGLIAQTPRLRAKGSRRSNYLWARNGTAQPPLEDLWSYSLEPLLSEYLAGVPADARDGVLGALRKLFIASVER